MSRGFGFCSVVAAVSFAVLSGCTTLPDDPDERAEMESLNDPLEPTNRAIFDVNMALDDAVMVPVAESYRSNTPDWFRDAVHNILTNLQEPYVAGNDLLQGNPRAAADSLGRFLINSTFGLLGARDAVADSGGAKSHKTDIGVTLAVWGIGEGPYMMLPLFGPSNLRDGTGKVAEFWASPTGAVMSANGLNVINNVQTGADVLDTRTNLLDPMKDLRRSSLDEYAAIRSLYRQSREASILAARQGQQASRAVEAAPVAPPAAPSVRARKGTGTGGKAAPAEHGSVEFVDPVK
ncbi:MlaA family lipoprotein [Magnetospirillum molischianum]|uniref:Surface lipoprotein n=1 Tax=Magnetospirillum molischianum DSM 120 TaxID=1150626 RepID=H8FWY3_MAGML|nr:VacJ family lipoprotein [Magnetospirillum molischianum]CCG42871.1 Surface lipoprotein [Magnetospirillum molischianum DSM 120]